MRAPASAAIGCGAKRPNGAMTCTKWLNRTPPARIGRGRRCAYHPIAYRIRHRLRFVGIEKTREIAPAGVVTQFDEAGAEFDAKEHPSQKHEGDRRGGDMRRAKERREKSCLEE